MMNDKDRAFLAALTLGLALTINITDDIMSAIGMLFLGFTVILFTVASFRKS